MAVYYKSFKKGLNKWSYICIGKSLVCRFFVLIQIEKSGSFKEMLEANIVSPIHILLVVKKNCLKKHMFQLAHNNLTLKSFFFFKSTQFTAQKIEVNS